MPSAKNTTCASTQQPPTQGCWALSQSHGWIRPFQTHQQHAALEMCTWMGLRNTPSPTPLPEAGAAAPAAFLSRALSNLLLKPQTPVSRDPSRIVTSHPCGILLVAHLNPPFCRTFLLRRSRDMPGLWGD